METLSKVKITIIRHAQSEFNAGIPGADKKPNCPLSEHGKKQASQIKGEFDLVFSHLFSSSKSTRNFSSFTNSNSRFLTFSSLS